MLNILRELPSTLLSSVVVVVVVVSYSDSSAFTSSKHDTLLFFLIRGIIFVETKITKLNPDRLLVA